MRWVTLVAVVTGLVLCPLTVGHPAAQVFKSTTDLVSVWATVVDRSGRAVTSLTADAFTLKEEGIPQPMAFFRSEDQTPLSVAIVVDTSGSMVDKIDDVQDALRHFVRLLRPEDEVFLLRFSDGVEVVAEPDDRTALGERIARLRTGGGTALFDAARDGADVVSRGRNSKRVVLLITDGNDTNSRARKRDSVDAITRSEALLYAVGIGHGESGSFGHDVFGRGHGGVAAQQDRVDSGTLQDLAEPTGGRHFVLEQAHRGGRDLIDEAIQDIANELRHQYTLGYYPTNTQSDNKFRRVTVETNDRSLKVRARRGYFPAPASR